MEVSARWNPAPGIGVMFTAWLLAGSGLVVSVVAASMFLVARSLLSPLGLFAAITLGWSALAFGLGVVLVVAAVGLVLMRRWAWWAAFAASAGAIVFMAPVVASEISCLGQGNCVPAPGLFPLPILTEISLAAALVLLWVTFHQSHTGYGNLNPLPRPLPPEGRP